MLRQRYGCILVILVIALYQVATETPSYEQTDLLRQTSVSSNTFVQWVLSLLQRPTELTNVTALAEPPATAATLTETTTIIELLIPLATEAIATAAVSTTQAPEVSSTLASSTTSSTTAMPSATSPSTTTTTNRPIITSTTTKTPAAPMTLNPPRNCTECFCGIANTQKRIVGGQETEVHQYPWVAMLIYVTRFYCAASLINDQYLITASHCVYGFRKERIMVRLLEHDRKMSNYAKIDRTIAEIITHPKWNVRTYDNDIAIIRLTEPVEMNDLLHPVCMPTPGKSFKYYTGIVTGWGATKVGGNTSDTLQEVKVPIMSQDQCRKTRYGAARITDNMLCAGYDDGKKDSCQGDSGGPLHVLATGTREHQLAGVVSWGEGCAKAGYPGVYSRVNRYGTWIKMMTRNACLCSSETKKIKKI